MRSTPACAAWALAGIFGFGALGCSDTVGPERAIDGQQLYENYCARCHGIDGRPVAEQPQARDLSNRRIVDALSDEAISMTVQRGRPPAMPAFKDEFTEASLMVLVAYVRSLSGSAGSKARPGAAGGPGAAGATPP